MVQGTAKKQTRLKRLSHTHMHTELCWVQKYVRQRVSLLDLPSCGELESLDKQFLKTTLQQLEWLVSTKQKRK